MGVGTRLAHITQHHCNVYTHEQHTIRYTYCVITEMADDSQSCDTAPLHTAASRGDLDEVGELLKSKQYEVDYRNSNNQTSLHLASANGHLDMVWMTSVLI